jgi:hypothetical protein
VRSKELLVDLIEGGGLKCCVGSMEQHVVPYGLPVNGCILIGNLFMRPILRKRVVDKDCLKGVAKALENFPQDAKVQVVGCRAIGCLLMHESSWAEAAADAGCMALVVAAMNKHPQYGKIQTYGCNFLACLSSAHKEYLNMVTQVKGIVSVGEALRIHSGNAKVKLAARRALIGV